MKSILVAREIVAKNKAEAGWGVYDLARYFEMPPKRFLKYASVGNMSKEAVEIELMNRAEMVSEAQSKFGQKTGIAVAPQIYGKINSSPIQINAPKELQQIVIYNKSLDEAKEEHQSKTTTQFNRWLSELGTTWIEVRKWQKEYQAEKNRRLAHELVLCGFTVTDLVLYMSVGKDYASDRVHEWESERKSLLKEKLTQLIARGRTTTEAAELVGISEYTAYSIIGNFAQKKRKEERAIAIQNMRASCDLEETISDFEIAQALHVSRSTVCRYTNGYGTAPRGNGKQKRKRLPVTAEQIAEINRLRQNGLSVQEIGKEMNMSDMQVLHRLHKKQ